MNVACYVRVSTQEQALNGHSIDEQIDRTRKYCESMGWTIYKVYTDAGQSGASIHRPALQQMIRDIEHGVIDKVVVYKLDRLSRSQRDTLYLIEDVFIANEVEFASMSESFDTSTAFGRAMVGILSVFAQLEREQIKERMKMGKDARAKEGLFSGGRYSPTGYTYVDGELVVDDYESMLVREVFDRAEKDESINGITTAMNAAGLYPRTGRWTNQRVRRVLRSETYIGNVRHSGKWYPGLHTPLITKEQYDNVQEILDERMEQHQQLNRRLGMATSYLGGFLVCARCGAKYSKTIARWKKKDGSVIEREFFTCNSRSKKSQSTIRDRNCKNDSWPVDKLTDLVFGEIKKLALDPDVIAEMQNSADEDNTQNAEVIRKEIKRIDAQVERLLDLYTVGNIPASALQQRINDLSEHKSELENQIAEIDAKRQERQTAEEVLENIETFEQILDECDFDEIRAVLEVIIRKIEIDGEDITIYWNFT